MDRVKIWQQVTDFHYTWHDYPIRTKDMIFSFLQRARRLDNSAIESMVPK